MRKELYSITVRGNNKTWSFDIEGTEEWQKEWREDGLEVDEVVNIIPKWIVDLGLVKLFCRIQDLFYGVR